MGRRRKKEGLTDGDKARIFIPIMMVVIYLLLKYQASPAGQAFNEFFNQFIP